MATAKRKKVVRLVRRGKWFILRDADYNQAYTFYNRVRNTGAIGGIDTSEIARHVVKVESFLEGEARAAVAELNGYPPELVNWLWVKGWAPDALVPAVLDYIEENGEDEETARVIREKCAAAGLL